MYSIHVARIVYTHHNWLFILQVESLWERSLLTIWCISAMETNSDSGSLRNQQKITLQHGENDFWALPNFVQSICICMYVYVYVKDTGPLSLICKKCVRPVKSVTKGKNKTFFQTNKSLQAFAISEFTIWKLINSGSYLILYHQSFITYVYTVFTICSEFSPPSTNRRPLRLTDVVNLSGWGRGAV